MSFTRNTGITNATKIFRLIVKNVVGARIQTVYVVYFAHDGFDALKQSTGRILTKRNLHVEKSRGLLSHCLISIPNEVRATSVLFVFPGKIT